MDDVSSLLLIAPLVEGVGRQEVFLKLEKSGWIVVACCGKVCADGQP